MKSFPLVFFFSFVLSTLLLDLSACQDKPAPPPDAEQIALVSDLLAAADTLPLESIPALVQSLSPMWTDSFYQGYLGMTYLRVDAPKLQKGLVQYQQRLPDRPDTKGIVDFYSGVISQWAGKYDSAEVLYARACQHFERTGNNTYLVRALASRSGNFNMMGRTDRDIAMKYQALELAEKLKDSTAIFMSRAILANSLNAQSEFDKVLQLTKGMSAWANAKKDTIGWAYVLLVEGNARSGKLQYEDALRCIGQCLALRRRAATVSKGTVMEGLYQYGRCLISMERWQEGLDTLRKAEAMNTNNFNKQMTPILYLYIGEALFNIHQVREAEDYGRKSLDIGIARKDIKNGLRAAKLLYEIKKKQGDMAQALTYHEQFLSLKDSFFNQERNKVMQSLTVKYETREKEQQIASLQKENALATQRNWWIGGSLLSLAMFGLFFVRQRARRKQEQLEKTLELQRIELESNQILLNDYTQMLLERNNSRIEALAQQQDAKHLSSDQSESPGTDRAAAEQLYQAIIDDTDWEQFQLRFSKVYPSFIPEIKQQMPVLTAGELRLLMLAKMGLSLKQSAVLLGIEANSVKTGRYRLRKKLQEVGAELAGLLAD